jgi:CRISPR-associated protein Cmr2
MAKYTGITIGPIYKTIQKARKTRELWISSYIFSFIMREIANKLKNKKFVLPYVNDEVFDIKEVGVFNDRMIFEGNCENLENIINNALKKLAEKTDNILSFDFLKNYIQLNYKEVEVKNGNIVEEVYKYLDSLELFFQTTQENNEFKKLFERVNSLPLAKEALKKNHSFPSLKEISLADILKEDAVEKGLEKEEKDENYDVFKDLNINFEDYHKYVAIVQVDGDNMGKVNKLLTDKSIEEYEELSRDLFSFVKEAIESVKEYGGQVVYAGGDDLLFFAPVKNNKVNKTILDLVKKLNDIYSKKMKKWNEELEKKTKKDEEIIQTTLSFGINVSYYKYPLYEALRNAIRLLFDEAKSAKNSVAIEIIKHSGQSFKSIISNSLLENITNLLNKNLNFDSSVIYKIESLKNLLKEILDDKERINAFFKNYFNENYSKNEKFFVSLSDFIYTYKDNQNILEIVYFILRYNKFLRVKNEKTN